MGVWGNLPQNRRNEGDGFHSFVEASVIPGGIDSYFGESLFLASIPIISASILRIYGKEQSRDDKIRGKKRKKSEK